MTTDRARYGKIRTCDIKHRYFTLTDAFSGIGKQFVYICEYCGNFHRTKQPTSKQMQVKVARWYANEQANRSKQ